MASAIIAERKDGGVISFIAPNVKRLCDGGFYAHSIFKTAIAKLMLPAVFFRLVR